jgi:SAM-dependent methyltransferase
MNPSSTASAAWYSVLPRLGSPAEFAAVRELFEQCGYSYENVCRRGQVESLDRYLLRGGALPEAPPEDALAAMIRLFTDCLAVERGQLEAVLPAGAMGALQRLNLLVEDTEDAARVYAPVPVYTAGPVLTACDRSVTPWGQRWMGPADMVFPPVYGNTLQFIDRLPQMECEAVLDIGTGSGVAALITAPLARQVWATDVAARSVHFAEFNRRLAGLDNITVLEGDLYAPVEGMTFDLIVSHPPYVPAKESKYIFREGGEDGEQILRAIVEGLPRFLRPGGRFYCAVMGADRENESFEARIRKWLGERHEEFDLVLISDSLKTPADYIAFVVAQNIAPPEEAQFLRELWIDNHTEYVFRGPVLIRRHAGGRAAVTARTQAGKEMKRQHLEWLLDFESSLREPEGLARLLETRPKIALGCEMIVHHREDGGRFIPEVFKFENKSPFNAGCQVQGWLAQTVAGCEGTRTWREYFDQLQARGEIPPDAAPEQFARMLGALVSSGILALA